MKICIKSWSRRRGVEARRKRRFILKSRVPARLEHFLPNITSFRTAFSGERRSPDDHGVRRGKFPPAKLAITGEVVASSGYASGALRMTYRCLARFHYPSGRRAQPSIRRDRLKPSGLNIHFYIGPMAKIIVDQVANHARSVEDLYQTLAPEIPSMQDREKFLRSRPL